MPENKPVSAPILLIVFNRPSKTRILVDFFKDFEGLDIFVAADGPRHDEEAVKCHEVRAIIEELSAKHQLSTKYSDRNLGCGTNVSAAIQWVLNERGEAIIIEDDVKVTREFLDFCNTNLVSQRDNREIACIAGGPLINVNAADVPPVFSSKYPNIWGWATWKRTFDGFDLGLTNYSNGQIWRILTENFSSKIVALYWFMIVALVRSGRIDTWDFQFYFMTWTQKARAMTPRNNLTENIGFDGEATHVKTAPDNVGKLDHNALASDALAGAASGPVPYSAAYDAIIERDLYKINLLKIAKFIVKYLITKRKPYR